MQTPKKGKESGGQEAWKWCACCNLHHPSSFTKSEGGYEIHRHSWDDIRYAVG